MIHEGFVIPFSCELAVKAVRKILARQGLQAVRSFDLRSALASHANCPCPHHGTAQCDCQFIVILIYGQAETPVVMTIHDYNGQTEMKILQDTASVLDSPLVQLVRATLREAALQLFAVPLETELTYAS